MKQFEKKFKDKSGLPWTQRGEKAKPGKYAFVEKSYDAESDEEDEAEDTAAKEKKGPPREPPKSTLLPAVQELVQLIFNKSNFDNTMAALKYDANKLPLGKLSKATITRGFQALKDLAAVIDDNSIAQDLYGKAFNAAIEDLSNSYYSVIPHAFGRNRPPVIYDVEAVKREIELLESLSGMKDAALLMKMDKISDNPIHPLDSQYQALKMREMTPLDPASGEFTQLQNYLVESRGDTHGHQYTVESIFRIEREGEFGRFDDSVFGKMGQNRRLLWHGSRCTNFGGILSQGLRIAPPEAPVSGYMFGKGIYLADMASKSANYCCSYMSNGVALLLLCEAELGSPMQELVDASYTAGEDAKQKGMISTWGKGQTGPSKWKDAGCVHPSLAGVMMVSYFCLWLGPEWSSLESLTNMVDAARHVCEARGYQCPGRWFVLQRVHLLRRLPGPPAVPAEGEDVSGGKGRRTGGGRDRSGRFRSCSLCRWCWFWASWRWRCHEDLCTLLTISGRMGCFRRLLLSGLPARYLRYQRISQVICSRLLIGVAVRSPVLGDSGTLAVGEARSGLLPGPQAVSSPLPRQTSSEPSAQLASAGPPRSFCQAPARFPGPPHTARKSTQRETRTTSEI
jgi:hypothetical protein